jgi:hypothetical protein
MATTSKDIDLVSKDKTARAKNKNVRNPEENFEEEGREGDATANAINPGNRASPRPTAEDSP